MVLDRPEGLIDSAPNPRWWSLAHRVSFRFAFSYWLLYSVPFPAGALPLTEWLSKPVEDLWKAVVPVFGRQVLGIARDVATDFNGSGDRTFDWVAFVLQLILAALVTVVWSVVDRRRSSYQPLREWLRVYVRYVVAFAMLSYGSYKVVKLQFPDLEPMRLLTPVGDFSPMGLLWTFMGFSTGYTFLAGAGEVLGGLLLLWRRTVTLGTLVTTAVMGNVVVLNFCYDVPVKLYSSHLLGMALWLLAPDLGRLARLFVFNRAVDAVPLPARPRWLRVGKLVFVTLLLFSVSKGVWEGWRQYGPGAPKPLLYGLYDVESFDHPGAARWSNLAVDRAGRVLVRTDDGTMQRFPAKADEKAQSLTLTRQDDGVSFVLTWTRPDADHLVLQGTLDGTALMARLKKVDPGQRPLVSRGFHWINEFPFNR